MFTPAQHPPCPKHPGPNTRSIPLVPPLGHKTVLRPGPLHTHTRDAPFFLQPRLSLSLSLSLCSCLLTNARASRLWCGGSPGCARWYRKACSQGHAGAMYNMGVMCEAGRGVARSREEAVRWYAAAAEKGHAQAQVFFYY